jgi:putative glutamine amidotransferase
MTAEALFENHATRLRRRLERMVGSREAAEDLSQEAFLRLWRSAPANLSEDEQRAWLERTASNLAVDELRRRRHRDHARLEEAAVAAVAEDGAEALAVHDALSRITPHQRLLVLLRFQAGLTHAEIGEMVDISAEAARKRGAIARRAFGAAYRGTLPDRRPVILLETRDPRQPYRDWLIEAGAEVRIVRPGSLEPQIAMADGIVIGGSVVDVHPSLYGEPQRVPLNAPDLAKDVRELRTVRAALEAGLPYVGICKGAQLLNVALGGSLYQDIQADGATRRSHWGVAHSVSTTAGSHARRILGREATVSSEHHQAAHRMGRGLRGTSTSADSIFESFELSGARLVLGLQWHPEHERSDADGRQVARALVDAAADRREGPKAR